MENAENTTQVGAQSGGAAGVEGASAVAADVGSDARAKRDAAAERKRKSRALKRAEAAQKEEKREAKVNGKASSADQRATADDESKGWPSKEAQAACMPAAVMMLTGVRFALGASRYGAALDPRTAEVVDPNSGETKTLTFNPINDQLAPPLAALLAQSAGSVTPGQALAFAAATLVGPVAIGHAVEGLVRFFDERKERREKLAAQLAAENAPRERVQVATGPPKTNAAGNGAELSFASPAATPPKKKAAA